MSKTNSQCICTTACCAVIRTKLGSDAPPALSVAVHFAKTGGPSSPRSAVSSAMSRAFWGRPLAVRKLRSALQGTQQSKEVSGRNSVAAQGPAHLAEAGKRQQAIVCTL